SSQSFVNSAPPARGPDADARSRSRVLRRGARRSRRRARQRWSAESAASRRRFGVVRQSRGPAAPTPGDIRRLPAPLENATDIRRAETDSKPTKLIDPDGSRAKSGEATARGAGVKRVTDRASDGRRAASRALVRRTSRAVVRRGAQPHRSPAAVARRGHAGGRQDAG
ncbi:hypothetical protein, partial [Burkholderia pseudomallei]|uniref:hypothetical protein n=1 Tax=Burkholderia pseudomallei TaxID=28450 RepID=UPI001E29C996